ncbi:thiamine ABC transporter substrate-binding protein, partial [Amycolatopsis sp.]|uniref:thiamine ABC transporter substrate-binding protein n=1 Tax=Amycolatopsis sp. TaxID=37632 RepID=UPI002E0B7865|nr:thiamine ABC transporter substrate-binding protein [Amycolatopsis sp.]
MNRSTLRAVPVAMVFCLVGALTAGCTLSGTAGDTAGPQTVTLVTHDSWAAPAEVLDAFERQSGIKITVLKEGDAGALTNKLVLTKANPIADVAYGVDSTFASRALTEGVFEPYTSPEADRGPQRYAVDPEHRLSAVDLGDVCVNVDNGYFASNGIPVPKSYEDLTNSQYKDLMVLESPATSSPGLAFLLGTVSKFGEDGWQEYWSKLKANGAKSVSGWTEAYTQDFSGSSGKGPRPIVVSYASSPAAEVAEDGKPRTSALLDTCYRQVEYAGVLTGSKQPERAHKVVDFLLSQQFQVTVAANMYVYPARQGVDLPAGWAQVAPLPEKPA